MRKGCVCVCVCVCVYVCPGEVLQHCPCKKDAHNAIDALDEFQGPVASKAFAERSSTGQVKLAAFKAAR